MKAYLYILYSSKLSVFYTGSTILEPEERLERHLSKYYRDNKFTAKSDDWEIFFVAECASKAQAIGIERHIKRMKSKIYIKNLTIYPEIIQKLKEKYAS